MFACEQASISPDFMCLSKGITGGYLPLSAVLTSDEVYNAFYDEYGTMKAFLHSHSYSGNTLACRVALEVLTIFEEEQIMDMIQRKGQQMRELAMAAFGDMPYVGEYRQVGLVGAIELVVDRQTKEPFASEERIGYQIYQQALVKGLLIRPLGNIVYFMPPYIISNEEMTFMINTTKETIEQFFKDRGNEVD